MLAFGVPLLENHRTSTSSHSSFHSFLPENASDGKTRACINHMTWLPMRSVYLEEKEKCLA